MATAVTMPKQGQSVETCIITRWFKKKGEKVSVGDLLFSYETDKAAFDFESTADGVLLDIFFEEGAEVPVLVNVAAIGKSGEATDLFKPGQAIQKETPAEEIAKEINQSGSRLKEVTIAYETAETQGKIRISPRAKSMATEKGLIYSNIKGSGPNGRIITADIEKALSADGNKDLSAEYTEHPLSNVRKIIAKAMYTSLQNSAQLTHHMSADVRRLLDARQKIKTEISGKKNQHDITLNDMICWCVIRALEKFPEVNSHFLEDRIKTFNKIHLGIAVDTSRGLMVPAVKNASDMDLVTLAKALREIADSCRKGNVSPEILQSTSASFTVSNLGNYGVEMFTPVINLPQAAILGVCTIINRPVDLGNHTFGFVPHIGLSLTYDHRAVDGGPATLFLKEIKTQIEGFNGI